jgi:hypothetical protein
MTLSHTFTNSWQRIIFDLHCAACASLPVATAVEDGMFDKVIVTDRDYEVLAWRLTSKFRKINAWSDEIISLPSVWLSLVSI